MLRLSDLAGVRYLQFAPLLQWAHFTHFVTLRQAVGDPDPGAWELCRRLGVREDRLIRLRQVHGSRILVNPELSAGSPEKGAFPEGDGLILTRTGWFGLIRTADCVPVIAVAPDRPAVALLHAGWRSLAAGIVEEGLRRFCEAAAVEPPRVQVALGPCIRSCCYEVGSRVPAAFRTAGRYVPELEQGKYFDLPAATRLQLRRAGVTRIYDSGLCTCCRPEICYSYRRDRTPYRHWTVAGFADS